MITKAAAAVVRLLQPVVDCKYSQTTAISIMLFLVSDKEGSLLH